MYYSKHKLFDLVIRIVGEGKGLWIWDLVDMGQLLDFK